MLKIAITGHRRLHDRDAVRKEIAEILGYFRPQHTTTQAISAIATGADTLFAQQALSTGVSLRVVLPFKLDEYEKDFDQSADKATLLQLIGQSEVAPTVVSTLQTHTPTERNEAYLRCGQYLVDQCDVLIAVWDGLPARGTGGTADIVAYAQTKGKEIHFVWSAQEANVPEEESLRKFREFDSEAIYYKDKLFKPAWITGLTTGVLAVVFFAAGLAFRYTWLESREDVRFILAALEAAGIACSALSLWAASKWKKTFLEHRRNAEYLRTLIWYKNAGIPIPPLQKVNYSASPDVLAIEADITKSITGIRGFAHAKRLAWQLAEEQIGYHQEKRITSSTSQESAADIAFRLLKWVFLTIVAVKFGIEVVEYIPIHLPIHVEDALPWLNFTVIVLPPFYAALEGVKYFGDWKRNVSISKEVIAELEAIKSSFTSCKDEAALLIETARLRQILDIENSAWAIEYGQKEVELKP